MASNLMEAEGLVAAIVQLKERAENAAREAETARSKADSESGFAFNAKNNSEEHAKAISQVRGTVDADLAWLTTTRKNAEEHAQSIATAKIALDADIRTASEAKTTIEKDAATVQAAINTVSATKTEIEKAKTDVASALNEVKKDTTAVTSAKTSVEAAMKTVQALQTQINEIASKSNVDGATTTKLEGESRVLLASIRDVVTKVKSTHEQVGEYEKKLAGLTESFDSLHSKIEGLLPNATRLCSEIVLDLYRSMS